MGELRYPPWRDAGPRRRERLRQDDHRARDPKLNRITEGTSPSMDRTSRAPRRRDPRLRRRIQLIFQDPYSSLNPRMSVGRAIAERSGFMVSGRGSAAVRDRVRELLAMVGLAPSYASRYPHEFSGGQRQRIGIARALACEPELIVCDEPSRPLTCPSRRRSSTSCRTCRTEFGLTYLFIAHGLSVIQHISDRVAVMYLGKIVEIGERREVYGNPRHPYTRSLLSAVPIPNPKLERRDAASSSKGNSRARSIHPTAAVRDALSHRLRPLCAGGSASGAEPRRGPWPRAGGAGRSMPAPSDGVRPDVAMLITCVGASKPVSISRNVLGGGHSSLPRGKISVLLHWYACYTFDAIGALLAGSVRRGEHSMKAFTRMATAVAFCVGVSPVFAQGAKDNLTIVQSVDVESLEPHALNASGSINVANHLWVTLLQVTASVEVQPYLAESWTSGTRPGPSSPLDQAWTICEDGRRSRPRTLHSPSSGRPTRSSTETSEVSSIRRSVSSMPAPMANTPQRSILKKYQSIAPGMLAQAYIVCKKAYEKMSYARCGDETRRVRSLPPQGIEEGRPRHPRAGRCIQVASGALQDPQLARHPGGEHAGRRIDRGQRRHRHQRLPDQQADGVGKAGRATVKTVSGTRRIFVGFNFNEPFKANERRRRDPEGRGAAGNEHGRRRPDHLQAIAFLQLRAGDRAGKCRQSLL